MINLNLTPWERVVISLYLPKESSYHEGILIQDVEDDIKLSDEERESFGVGFSQNGDIVTFEKEKKAKSDEKEFSFPKAKFRIIKNAFEKADKNKSLIRSRLMFDLYDKIMDAKEESAPEEPK